MLTILKKREKGRNIVKWGVCERYNLKGHLAPGNPEDAYKMSFEKKEIIPQCFILPERSSSYKTYNPLETPDLFFKFCFIGNKAGGTEEGMEKAILEWIGQFGMLHDYDKCLGQLTKGEYIEEIRMRLTPHSVEYFCEQINQANSALHVYTQFLDERNKDKLEWDKDSDKFYDEFIIPDLNRYFDTYLKGIRPCIRHDKDAHNNPKHRIVPDWVFPDLLTMIWWQFYGIVTEEKNIQRCWYCDRHFVPNIGGQKFCPIIPGSTVIGENNHSKCSNGYYAWLNRQKEKAHGIWMETGDIEKTRSGIAIKHPVDKETIEKWAKEWQG